MKELRENGTGDRRDFSAGYPGRIACYLTCIMQNQPMFDYFNINTMSGHKCTPSSMNIIQILDPLTAPLNVIAPKKYQMGAATI